MTAGSVDVYSYCQHSTHPRLGTPGVACICRQHGSKERAGCNGYNRAATR